MAQCGERELVHENAVANSSNSIPQAVQTNNASERARPGATLLDMDESMTELVLCVNR
jgi:hypothetical protein